MVHNLNDDAFVYNDFPDMFDIDFLCFNESWETINKNLKYLIDFKGNGKNNKMKFKLMDIQDIIRKNQE